MNDLYQNVTNEMFARALRSKRRVCYVATAGFTIKWYLAAHLKAQREMYDLTIIADGKRQDLASIINENTEYVPLPIKREISLFNDLYVLFWLVRFFRAKQFDCVHSIMMKSGLLAMIAANLARVPVRLHTFTGQRWVTKHGFFRKFLKFMDRCIVANATYVFADSNSQKNFICENKIAAASQITVLGDGSIMGIDTKRFVPDEEMRIKIRARYNIGEDDVAFIFVGRLSADKGLLDLLQAFEELRKSSQDIHLMIVGPDEGSLLPEFEKLSQRHPGSVHLIGHSDVPEHFLAAVDVLCLPSYREGFGNVIIEAALVGIPAVASRIYGITDAIEEGITGIFHQAGSVKELHHAMSMMLSDKAMRLSMGRAARERGLSKYPQERLTKALIDFHEKAFNSHHTTRQRGISLSKGD